MRNRLFEFYQDGLKESHSGRIIYYNRNRRIEKSYLEFGEDIDLYGQRILKIHNQTGVKLIGILGETSYDWLVLDHACIKYGFKTVAIPETFSKEQIQTAIDDLKIDLILSDYQLSKNMKFDSVTCYYYGCNDNQVKNNFNTIKTEQLNQTKENKILEEYSITFTSGTTNKTKYIQLKWATPPQAPKKVSFLKRIYFRIKFYRANSFFRRKDHKILIYLPFSHRMQRDHVIIALFNKWSIVVSNPTDSFKHLILEKPNIMVSIPTLYEAIAKKITQEINKLSGIRKLIFNIFNWLNINDLRNNNLVKKGFSNILFKKMKRYYGGRADYFVTGSAPINPKVIRVFYSIGVKLYEAYGLSEYGNIAMSTVKFFKIGSVGKPIVEVKISEESEVLVPYIEEIHKINKSILKIDDEGYVHTGDIGHLDREGYLFIKGRKDNVIVLDNGKKVFPERIEEALHDLEFMEQVMVMTMDKIKLSAIITSDLKIDDVKGKIIDGINEVNKKLASYERISSVYITNSVFKQEDGLLTSTFKLKRDIIKEQYRNKDFIAV